MPDSIESVSQHVDDLLADIERSSRSWRRGVEEIDDTLGGLDKKIVDQIADVVR